MAYTQKLINEVKACYPESKKMLNLAKSGNIRLGRCLEAEAIKGISIGQILLATSLEELQNEARLANRKIKLYNKWCKVDPRNFE